MIRIKGLWQVSETVQKYKSSWLEVNEDQVVRPDGDPGVFATVVMKPGVSVLAMDDDSRVYLTSEYRYAIDRESIEVVSGGIEEGESADVTARRELREELGIEAIRWTDLGSVDPFTSIVHSPAKLFLANDLSFVDDEPEGTEIIKVVKVDLKEAVRMVMDSEITHGPSCVLILKTYLVTNNPSAADSAVKRR